MKRKLQDKVSQHGEVNMVYRWVGDVSKVSVQVLAYIQECKMIFCHFPSFTLLLSVEPSN